MELPEPTHVVCDEITEIHKLLKGISFTLFRSKYYIDSDYDSDEEYTDKIEVFGYIIKEDKPKNSLIVFNYNSKIFCCVIPSIKYKDNMQTKKICSNTYEKIINNYIDIKEDTILEFKNTKCFIQKCIYKCYNEKKTTCSNRETYYI